MARYSGKKRVSEQTRDEALAIAEGTRRPGQTKEQTRLIAQGIRHGIDLYKKKHKAKARDLDRKLRRAQEPAPDTAQAEVREVEVVRHRVPWLPWLLLALTWAGIGAYFLAGGAR